MGAMEHSVVILPHMKSLHPLLGLREAPSMEAFSVVLPILDQLPAVGLSLPVVKFKVGLLVAPTERILNGIKP